MFELTAGNCAEYLAARGFTACRTSELGGGVSNTVVLAECAERRVVVKQSLERLSVAAEWLSDRDRIFRESTSMRRLRPFFPSGALPEILFEDRGNCLFGMSAAPAGARTWKADLMSGHPDLQTAHAIGRMLACMISASWKGPDWEAEFGDQTVFRQLRIDPYYRTTARRHADLAPAIERLIRESAGRRVSLVHGDWSPKNFLLHNHSVMAIDFEVIHFGDPAFDAAFLLNHLMLKSIHLPQLRKELADLARTFWTALAEGLPAEADWMETATIAHLGCLMLARVDGKSPVEYLNDVETQQTVRCRARELIQHPPTTLQAVFAW